VVTKMTLKIIIKIRYSSKSEDTYKGHDTTFSFILQKRW